MDGLYYEMIFKRKSFRRFDDSLFLTDGDLEEVTCQLKKLKPLVEGIEVEFKLVEREKTTSKRGQYCVLAYSEIKEHYLLNIGYLLEQLDLYLASKDIGACWYGMGKPNAQELNNEGMPFCIMLAIGKALPETFRKDYTKAKRKDIEVIWVGNQYKAIAEVVRYAPSACNSQPWQVVEQENNLALFRVPKEGRSLMPRDKIPYYNSMDLGAFMYILELCFSHAGYSFERHLCPSDEKSHERVQIASYSSFFARFSW